MKKKLFAIFLAGVLPLSGCGATLSAEPEPAALDSTILVPQSVQEASGLPSVAEQEGQAMWAREQLPTALQSTYDALDDAISRYQQTPVAVTVTPEELRLVITALGMDHPEYFWFDGQAAYVSTTTQGEESISCELSYTMDWEDVQTTQQVLEAYVETCFSTSAVSQAQDDYETILAVYRYIIEHTDYVVEEPDQTLISVVTQGRGTCAGYARLFQYLMHQLDIPCTLALGYSQDGESHGWNVVFCQGNWYHVDVTWGDPLDAQGQPGDTLSYTYFMLTDGEIQKTHTPEGDIPLPKCNATECNYYRKSGLQLSHWDSLSYEGLMRRAVEQQEVWFTVRFDGKEAYDRAMEALIEDSGIMTVFSNCGISVPEDGVTYSYQDTFYEISVKISEWGGKS